MVGITRVSAWLAKYLRAATGSVEQTLQVKLEDLFSASDFGIVPNVSEDQSDHFQAAIKACKGKQLYLAAGTYIARLGSITNSCTIVGAGISDTFIHLPDSTNAPILQGSGEAHIQLSGITLDGNSAKQSVATPLLMIDTSNTYLLCDAVGFKGGLNGAFLGNDVTARKAYGDVRFNHCLFQDSSGPGAVCTQLSNIYFEGCQFLRTGDSSISLSWNKFPPEAAGQTRCFIDKCRFEDSKGAAVFLVGFTEGGTPTAPLYGHGTHANYYNSVTNNFAFNCKGYGLAIQSNCVHVDSNTVISCGDYTHPEAASYSGILVNSTYFTCNSNIVKYCSGFGMDLGGSTFGTCNDNLIMENCNQTGGGYIGLNLGGCQYVTYSGNTVGLNGSEQYGVQIMVPGYDGGVTSFTTLTTALHGVGNTVILGPSSSDRIGIKLYGRPLLCSLSGNRSTGGKDTNSYVVATNEPVTHSGNLTDTPMPQLTASPAMVVPDLGSEFFVNGAADINNLVTASNALYMQRVAETQVMNGGSGYDPKNPPSVSFSGGGGSGAAAYAAVDGAGRVVSINITNSGSGYTSTPTITVQAPVSGVQATAVARVGCMNFTGRKFSLSFGNQCRIVQGNSILLGGNSSPLTVPATGTVQFVGTADGYFRLYSKSF